MKRLLVLVAVLAVVATAGLAGAHGPFWGGGPGTMAGYWGMGPGMMWGGYGPGYCTGPGSCFGPAGYDQKFLDETKDLRKALNEKRFEYFEALRNPETKPETLEKLQKEVFELQQKLFAKAPAYRGGFGPGWCWRY